MSKVDQAKAVLRKVAEIEGPPLVIPVQVLAEFYHVLVRKSGCSAAEAAGIVRKWQAPSKVVGSDERVFEHALRLAERHRVPVYDALILNSVAGHAEILLSEDFQDGFVWRGVTVRNPFSQPI